MSTMLDELLQGVEANAALPLDHAMSMDPRCYSSADFHNAEQRGIFGRSWICAGRASEVETPGSWLRCDIAGEPMVITRSDDGAVHALSRVCRHRSMDLLAEHSDDAGVAPRLTCPYHAWSYRLDGSLIGAPEMQHAANFDAEGCRLPEFAVVIWQGFIFVNLDPSVDATDFDRRVEPLLDQLGSLDFGDYVTATKLQTDELDGNWKSAFENSIEGYHNLGTHRRSLLPMFPVNKMLVEGTRTCVWGWSGRNEPPPSDDVGTVDLQRRDRAASLVAMLPGAPERMTEMSLVFGVFPSFFVVVNPNSVVVIVFEPAGPLRHRQTVYRLYPRATAEAYPDEIDALAASAINAVIAEDFAAIESVGRGLRAPSARSGHLSHHEALLWRFQQYVADQMVWPSAVDQTAMAARTSSSESSPPAPVPVMRPDSRT